MSIRSWWTAGLVLVTAACADAPEPVPPPTCEAAWAGPEARDLVQGLVGATVATRTVWPGYALSDGAYVVHAGPSESGGACVGLWRSGRAVAYADLPDTPSLLTPLYGYYFSADWHGAPHHPMLDRATQAPSWRTWLEGLDVESAVIIPATVRDFPIELPAFAKVQLAVHEGFHVFVQAPRWYAAEGAWPDWDRQPDRRGVHACYTASAAVTSALDEERSALVRLVTNLLDGDSTQACGAGVAFLDGRAARYELLNEVPVTRHDSSAGSCGEAEALMELEEGTADYASWTVLYDLGQTTRERLIQRYQAQQNDVFYLTGAMQLHAVQLMTPAGMDAVARGIIGSPGVEEGSITTTLRGALASYCTGVRAAAP